MGFLNPLFLLAAAAVAVPLLLHLLHRRKGRRLPFPALRYLRKVTQEHARSVRLRQLLLLALRIGVILFLVGAGARLYLHAQAGDHEPTALVVILDNSLSTGVVEDDERVLDRLREGALRSVSMTGSEDRIWVIRAAEPWALAPPGDRANAERRIRDARLTQAPADLPSAIRRAAELVSTSPLPAAEIHLHSDLQASSLPAGELRDLPPDVPVVARFHGGDPPPNRWLGDVTIGGGLPPLEREVTEVAVRVHAEGEASAEPIAVRLFLEDELRATATVEPGATVVLPAGPFPPGWVRGYLEMDADALRGDDRRYFTFRVRAPPLVALAGTPGAFLEEAIGVLEAAGRIGFGGAGDPVPGAADVVLASDGEPEGGFSGATVHLPPDDPARLPAFNRRLAAAGVPWRVEVTGEPTRLGVERWALPLPPGDVVVESRYELRPVGGGAEGTAPEASPPGTVEDEEGLPSVGAPAATLEDGTPWVVAGTGTGGPYLVVGTPIHPDHTSLALSPAMIPFVDWLAGGWTSSGAGLSSLEAGETLPLPPEATGVVDPSGTLHATDGTPGFRSTGEAGIYEVVSGDSVLELVAVNPPEGESRLRRLSAQEARERLGPAAVVATSEREWDRSVFQARLGPELWRPLLAVALLLLLVEAWAASSGARPSPLPGSGKAPGSERSRPQVGAAVPREAGGAAEKSRNR